MGDLLEPGYLVANKALTSQQTLNHEILYIVTILEWKQVKSALPLLSDLHPHCET